MKRKKIIRYTLLGLLGVVVAAGLYILKEYNRKHKDTARVKPAYTVSATALLQEFESDETASNKKYLDKVLRVEGMVKALEQDEKGFYSVILGDTSSPSSVRCSIDSVHSSGAVGLTRGRSLAIKGVCTGFNADELLGSDVILVRSVVDTKQ